MAVIIKFIILLLGIYGTFARTIDVKLTAPWPTTPLSPLLEASEFMSEEGKFWDFVSALRQPETIQLLNDAESNPYSEIAHEQISSLVVDIASNLISNLQLAALRLTLSVRSFAPLIETHRSLALLSSNKCDSSSHWMILHPSGKIICDINKIDEILNQNNSNESLYDEKDIGIAHEYIGGSSQSSSLPSATFYGRLGTSQFWLFYDELINLQNKNLISTFSFQHSIIPSSSSTSINTALQGYGVNLDIKNMEYMNMDDSHESSSSSDDQDENKNQEEDDKIEFPENENINGFIFSNLLKRKPNLGNQLFNLRNELIQQNDGDNDDGDNMKVWKMKDLGLQATYDIMNDKDPLNRLMKVSQNFPVYANSLSRIKVDKSLRQEVHRVATSGLMNLLGSGGGSQLFVNGRAVNIGLNTFNLFSLIDTIRSETRQLAKLTQLNLPKNTASKLLEIGIKGGGGGGANQQQGGGGGIRIDIVSESKGAITFLNNLEKDAEYKRWPKNLRQLLQPSWSLITLGRNLYTLIMIIDPTTEEGLNAIKNMNGLYKQMYPIRFGVVLTSADLINEYNEYDKLVPLSSTSTFLEDKKTKAIDDDDDDEYNVYLKATANEVGILFASIKSKHSSVAAFKFLSSLTELPVGYSVDDVISCYVVTITDVTGSWSTSGLREEAVTILQTQNIHSPYYSPSSSSLSTNEDEDGGNDMVSSDGDQMNGFSGLSTMTKFASKKGLKVNSFTLNGLPGDSLDFQSALMPLLGAEQQLLQHMVHDGRLGGAEPGGGKKGGNMVETSKSGKTKSVLSILMSESNAVPRYHPLVDESPSDMNFLLPTPSLLSKLNYLHASGTRNAMMKTVSMILIDDWSTKSGLRRLTAAVNFLMSGDPSADKARLAALFSPSSTSSPSKSSHEEGGIALQSIINVISTSYEDNGVLFLNE
jgi:UDP-glucose:glycoprotein glucosyltransferase